MSDTVSGIFGGGGGAAEAQAALLEQQRQELEAEKVKVRKIEKGQETVRTGGGKRGLLSHIEGLVLPGASALGSTDPRERFAQLLSGVIPGGFFSKLFDK